ncbi:MAG: hypothetical protein ACPG4T_06640 [Nannocystaceae bacterium]
MMKSVPGQRALLACTMLVCLTAFACTPDIPNYEGFWDDEARRRCGNGMIDFHSEECDEGPQNSQTGFCSLTCKKATCGDGLIQLDEACDLGSENANDGACSLTCTQTFCGDGIVQPGEACDQGDDNTDIPYGGGCSNDCQPIALCGDGTLDLPYEVCDDGNDSNSDACTNACQIAACGDGLIEVGVEACDDANDDESDACLSTCELATCGDGYVHAGEEECDGQANCNESCTRDRYVFVTNEGFHGDIKKTSNLSGIHVADSICRTRANAAGLKGEADFLAWLSDDETSPAERFFHSPGRYVLPDGTVVANSWADLTDGTLQNPILMTETKDLPQPSTVWTNTGPDGMPATEHSCQNWSSVDLEEKSIMGLMAKTDSEWTAVDVLLGCFGNAQIYCFEQK